MPSATLTGSGSVTKFTNCRLVKGNDLVEQDLWVSSITGKILKSQQEFYSHYTIPDRVIDLGGRIISPGLIDVQLNGAFGFNFSTPSDDPASYGKTLRQVNRSLVTTGVTSYLPTVTSQKSEVYHQVLPFLGPSGAQRLPSDGAESLGAHIEGPFLNPSKNGIHTPEVLISASSYADLEACYGAPNLSPSHIKMITAAPEVGNMTALIPEIVARDIIFSIGHSEATYEDASAAVAQGARMITHLFNAMRPLHHRNPGIFGVLGQPSPSATAGPDPRPYFGIIADGIHLHPSSITIAYNAHPSGMILVTDAMHLVGLPDGTYSWSNGERIVKRGAKLTLEGSDKIAGSSISLVECVNNFLNWSGASVPEALRAVTGTPARMLGLEGVKGSLEGEADADLVVFGEAEREGGGKELVVDQVWKFGSKVFDREF
jgi:N-acetylglucosamine-6-phosphate deacetylase